MNISGPMDKLHADVKQNKWMRYFAVFIRIALAWGFLSAGFVKIIGERFASGLSANHPMGQYLIALHHTGFYYTFIGIWQILAAVFLLIPRTATLGAIIYFPIILNIWILSVAVRFEGSLFTSTLMVLANLYLLCWDYHKLKILLPLSPVKSARVESENKRHNFPVKFFSGVAITMILVLLLSMKSCEIYPRNSLKDCQSQCQGSEDPQACIYFCDCIHKQGKPLEQCLEEFEKAKENNIKKLK